MQFKRRVMLVSVDLSACSFDAVPVAIKNSYLDTPAYRSHSNFSLGKRFVERVLVLTNRSDAPCSRRRPTMAYEDRQLTGACY